jgi:hypothetical protein
MAGEMAVSLQPFPFKIWGFGMSSLQIGFGKSGKGGGMVFLRTMFSAVMGVYSTEEDK